MLVPLSLQINAIPIQIKAGKMDDFISQLMASEKFEQLTDIIVNKAVNKIRIPEQKPMNEDKLNKTEDNLTVYRHNDEGENSSDGDANSDGENEDVTEENEKKTNLKQEHEIENKTILKKQSNPKLSGKIDVRTLLHDVPTEDLLLSFKHLIDSQKKKPIEKAPAPPVPAPAQKNKDNDKQSYESNSQDDVSDNKNQETKKEGILNNIKEDKIARDYEEPSSEVDNLSHYVEKKEEKDKESNKLAEKKSQNHQKGKKSAEKSREVTKMSSKRLNERTEEFKENLKPKKKIEKNKLSKEIIEVNIDNDNSENGTDNKKNREESTTKNDKKIYREENGKVFTYKSSSEYDEYHEKLLEEEKKRTL